MNDIIKTEAIVLSKLDFRETSFIANIYTKDAGKMSVMIKGAKSSKSKVGRVVDPMNYISAVIYRKNNREMQFLSSADLIDFYPHIKEDFDKMTYAFAVIELVNKIILENEPHLLLFKGMTRILTLLNTSTENPQILFSRFFLFFLKEIGYQVQLRKCSICGKTSLFNSILGYNYEIGILCGTCRLSYREDLTVDTELFNYLFGLNQKEPVPDLNKNTLDKAVAFLEKHLKYHIPDFSGIQSIQIK